MARQVWHALFGSAIADALVAGFAALAVAFVAWAMPDDIFSNLVAATGLAAIVPAAQPPLGGTARLLVIVAASGGIFVLLFALLRLVSYRPVRRRAVKSAPLAPMVPRVRRADAHPDAPSRAPISAMFELGTPIPPPWPEPEVDAADAYEPEPAPWIEPEKDEVDAYPHAPGPSPKAKAGEADAYSTASWLAARVAKQSGESDELVLSEPFAPPPEDRPEPVRLATPVRKERVPARGNESLAELMQRLERGLARMGNGESHGEPPAAPDERLRSAIEDLQRLAAR